jgi:hypothetical protein
VARFDRKSKSLFPYLDGAKSWGTIPPEGRAAPFFSDSGAAISNSAAAGSDQCACPTSTAAIHLIIVRLLVVMPQVLVMHSV